MISWIYNGLLSSFVRLFYPRFFITCFRCRMKCFHFVNEDTRDIILKRLLELPTKDAQDLYLQTLIEKLQIKQRHPRKVDDEGNAKERNASFNYFVVDGAGAKLKVCRKAFLSLHAVTQKRVFRLTQLLMKGSSPVDRRGKNPCLQATPDHILKLMDDHIKSFPTKSTHYGSAEVTYLDARLNMKIMHELFTKKYPETNIKYERYRSHFVDNYNFRFGRPQIDVCSKCEELEVKVKSPHLAENVKRAAQGELLIHTERSKKFYKSIAQCSKMCSEFPEVGGLCFDYMQNLPLPHIPVQEVFYMRQLWVYVSCIHDLKTKTSMLYVYHEGEAHKGANEVASFIYDYVANHLDKNVKTLHLFSDGCPGQTKNHTLIRALMGLTANSRLEEIYHRFPERGHSFLPCDRDFGVFKRKLKKSDRIYSPLEYVEILANSKSNVLVKLVRTEEIMNFNEWWPLYFRKDAVSKETFFLGRECKKHFTPMSFKQFEYKSASPGQVIARPFIDSLVQHTFLLGKPRLSREDIGVPAMAYPSGSVPINPKKLNDVKKLMQYVKEEARPFYEKIINWPTGESQDEDEDED